MKFTWSSVAAILSVTAGAVGTTLTPTLGSSLSTAISAILQAISGLLLAIPTISASMVLHNSAAAKIELSKIDAIAAKHGSSAVTAYLTGKAA